MIKTYYLLTKPGIIFGNLITTASGFILASHGQFNSSLFLATMVGIAAVIASACIFNNYIDRESDKKMARTKNRALARGDISNKNAIFLAIFLGLLGLLTLALYTNYLPVLIALFGFLVYVALYSFWKHHSSYATLVGSIAGAVPPVIGYTAASHQLDAGAFILFAMLVFWQMPHFYAIAIYQIKDYAAAAIPVLPAVRGMRTTKIQMLVYVLAFSAIAPLLTVLGYTGKIYLSAMAFMSLAWIYLAIQGWKTGSDKRWARKMFLFSLIVILVLCAAIIIN